MHAFQLKNIRQLPLKLLVANSLIFGQIITPAHATDVQVHTNKETGLKTWTAIDSGFSIELIQLLPDFVRAIYGSHGFPKAEIEKIAAYCVFGTIIKNTSQQRLNYRVDDWYYQVGNESNKQRIKAKTLWLEQWRTAGITFSWTLLPDQGVFEVGDWQQGFTTIKLPRESTFNFFYSWTLDDKIYTGNIKNLQCAPDEAP